MISHKNVTFWPVKSAYIYCTFFMVHTVRESRLPGARSAARLLITLKLLCTLLISYSFTLFCLRIVRTVLLRINACVRYRCGDEEAFLLAFAILRIRNSREETCMRYIHPPVPTRPSIHTDTHTYTQCLQLYTLRKHTYWLAT